MFTSRRSNLPTVLLCGDRWWLPGRDEPVLLTHRDEAVRALLAAWADELPRRIRLIFHPEGFANSVIPCPQANRRTLALALQEQFPGVGTADVAWSHDPILPLGQGFTTVLHREAEPWLVTLVADLTAASIEVDSVWPMPTWLHALPEEWSNSGAVTVLAAVGDRACAYRHPAGGTREVVEWPGHETTTPEQWLRAILAREPDEPVLVVTADAPAIAAFASAGQTPVLRHLPLAEALTWPAIIPSGHPAQLLPAPSLVSASRATVAAGIALVALAGWSVAPWAMAHAAARTDVATLLAREQALRREVVHLRSNADEITALRAALSVRSDPFAGRLLREIAATIPAEITLATLHATADAFEARGFAAPDAGGSGPERWQKTLAARDERVRFVAEVPANHSAPFRLRATSKP